VESIFFLKLDIQSKNRLIRRDKSHRPLGGRLESGEYASSVNS